MSKVNLKERLLRILILFIGLVIAHLGVTLFLLANLGADPFNEKWIKTLVTKLAP